MTRDPHQNAEVLRREIGLIVYKFPLWEKPPSTRQHALSSGEIVTLLTSLGVAVASVDVALEHLDKSAAHAEAIIKRLSKMYTWARDKLAATGNDDHPLSDREKVLVLLFDAYVTDSRVVSIEELASSAEISHEACDKILSELKELGRVSSAANGRWLYRSAL